MLISVMLISIMYSTFAQFNIENQSNMEPIGWECQCYIQSFFGGSAKEDGNLPAVKTPIFEILSLQLVNNARL